MPTTPADPVILCYDGSEDSKQAIEETGSLFAGAHVLVLTAWQPKPGLGSPALDHTAAKDAKRVAAEGVDLANAAGLQAESIELEAPGPVWQSINDVADHHHAALIVVGSRGLTGLRSVLLGSVSSAVVHHAHHPTLVVHADRESATEDPEPAGSTLTGA